METAADHAAEAEKAATPSKSYGGSATAEMLANGHSTRTAVAARSRIAGCDTASRAWRVGPAGIGRHDGNDE